MTTEHPDQGGSRWRGLRASARDRLETRDYSSGDPALRLASTGVPAAELIGAEAELAAVWIPGVEVFPRRKVYPAEGPGVFR